MSANSLFVYLCHVFICNKSTTVNITVTSQGKWTYLLELGLWTQCTLSLQIPTEFRLYEITASSTSVDENLASLTRGLGVFFRRRFADNDTTPLAVENSIIRRTFRVALVHHCARAKSAEPGQHNTVHADDVSDGNGDRLIRLQSAF